jgi:2'-5' RNA ligase
MEIRCFIAVGLTEEIRGSIEQGTRAIRELDADVRWAPVGNMHLTLKFLGNTPEELLPTIREGLLRAGASRRRFNVGFSGVGAFPDRRRPRVFWIGVSEGAEYLVRLQNDVEKSMAELGFEPEQRKYSPHLTIGRVRSERGKGALMTRLDTLGEKDFGRMEVEAFSLFQSELGPRGARHTRLFEIGLS